MRCFVLLGMSLLCIDSWVPSSPSWDPTLSSSSRRGFFTAATIATSSLFIPSNVYASNDDAIDVYFGMGCFWHIQHEFVTAEISILKRKELELTARAGYAGGKKLGKAGRVCYHNLQGSDDYGKYGHCEVVGLSIPRWSYEQFCRVYFSLFDSKGNRPDQFGDRGGEYRNVMGIPNKDPELVAIAEKVSAEFKSVVGVLKDEGKGGDEDRRGETYVMDSNASAFPFHLGEFYHQFHDGFAPGENYPASYNNIKNNLEQSGLLADTGCPFV